VDPITLERAVAFITQFYRNIDPETAREVIAELSDLESLTSLVDGYSRGTGGAGHTAHKLAG